MPKHYSFPKGMRLSTLKERRDFYRNEFDFSSAKRWLKFAERPVFAIDIGTDSGIYDKRFENMLKKLIYISRYDSWSDLREKLIDYAPEDVYYNRNVVRDYEKCRNCKRKRRLCFACTNFITQELIFDLDPENVDCEICSAKRKNDKKAGIYSFCRHSMEKIRGETVELYRFLKHEYGLKKLRILFSGRGFHIHVFDEEAFHYSKKERRNIAKRVEKEGFHIDPWVSSGNIDLSRLPGSLNGLVNKRVRVLTLKELKTFNPFTS